MKNFHDRIIRREEAEPILAPHLGAIQTCCLKGHEAWKEFAEAMPHIRVPLMSRTMANFVNDWVVQHARTAFLSVERVEAFEERGLFCLSFQRKILLRFKKADDDDMTRNYPTKQQMELGGQELQRLIPGWEEATWVSACYHFTPTLDAIDRIRITCRRSDHLLWCIPVYDAETDSSGGIIPFPEPQGPQPTDQRKSRVKPRNVKKPDGHE
jgi:hypothetical protein